jgi:hypothetical protein
VARRSTVRIVGALAALSVGLALTSCGDDDAKAPLAVAFEAPYFDSVRSLSLESTLVVDGTVIGDRGVFRLESGGGFGYHVYEVQVDDVLGRAGVSVSTAAPGDTVFVGLYAATAELRAASPQVATDVDRNNTALGVGERVVVFGQDFDFAPDVRGIAAVGGDFGVFDVRAGRLAPRASTGDLALVDLTVEQLSAQLAGDAELGANVAQRRAEQQEPDDYEQPEGSIVPTTRAP